MNIAVLGSGSWATAIVKILSENSDKIHWWVREAQIAQCVQEKGHNPLFLRACELDRSKIEISTDIESVVSRADHIFCVIPSAFVEQSFSVLDDNCLKGKKIIIATKGIIPSSDMVVSRFFKEKYRIQYTSQCVISGPSHAEEIAQERLTYLTCGSESKELAKKISDLVSCPYVKTVISDDIDGIEYATVLKNVYALSAGIAIGLGYGDNFIAVLMSNAIVEMERFLNVVDKRNRDIRQPVYLGDLLVTAYSQHSRNRTFGQMIGKGYSVKSAQMEMNMIAEGYYSANGVHKINEELKVKVPIVEAVYRILYQDSCAEKEFENLSAIFS